MPVIAISLRLLSSMILATCPIVHAMQSKAAVPATEALAAAEAALEKQLKPKYQAARKPAEKAKLGLELDEMAQQAGSDHAMRWALLQRARELAIAGADFQLHAGLVDQLCAGFEVDELPTRREAWGRYAKSAPASKDKAAQAKVSALLGELEQQAAAAKLVETARATLLQVPEDPAANATIGMHECFERRDWARGLAHLARGDKQELAALATRDLDAPVPPSDRIAMGLDWVAWAVAKRGAPRDAAMDRGRLWLGRAWLGSSAAQRERILLCLRKHWLEGDKAVEERLGGKWVELAELPKPAGSWVEQLVVSRDQRHFAAKMATWDPEKRDYDSAKSPLVVWDAQSSKMVVETPLELHALRDMCFSPDGALLLMHGAKSGAAETRIVSLPGGRKLWSRAGEPQSTHAVSFGPIGRSVLVVEGTQVELHDLWTRSRKDLPITLPGSRVLEFSPDGRKLAAWNAAESVVQVHDMLHGQAPVELRDAGFRPSMMAWVGSDWLVTGDTEEVEHGAAQLEDPEVRLWDAVAGVVLARFKCSGEVISNLAVSVTGKHALVSSYKRTNRIGDRFSIEIESFFLRLDTGEELPFPGPFSQKDVPPKVAFLSQGKALGVDREGRVRVWSISAK